MSSSLIIESIVNNNDGLTATVTVSGAPTGTVSFVAARIPDSTKSRPADSVLLTSVSGISTYLVYVQHPGLWYLWVQDSNGLTAVFGAVWVDFVSDNSDTDLLGYALRDILWNNKLGIEAILTRTYPGKTLQQVVYGYEGAIEDYPSILITGAKTHEEYVAFPFVRQVIYSYSISCIMVHNTEETQTPLIAQFVRGVMDILNQPDYETIILPNTLIVNFAFAMEGDVQEFETAEKFVTVGSILWSARAIRQDTGY